jgi:septal ring factor EnvC (AmiA/AmiB activator)
MINNTVLRKIILSAAALILLSWAGCARKPSAQEMGKLDEARLSVEAAEKKLNELREERIKLEATLEAKKEELRRAETERDSIKAKLGQ